MTNSTAPSPTWHKPQGEGTLSADIIRQIQDQVFSGKLKPGDFLGSEASLAESFDVSRMAMRDALRGLATTGLIEVKRGFGGGVRIASGNLEFFATALATQFTLLGTRNEDLIEAQIATETMITTLAAERARPEDVARLREILDRGAGKVEDSDAFVHILREFHDALSEIARNLALAVILQGIVQLLQSARKFDTTPEVAGVVLRRYRKVVDAIAAGDATAAAVEMRDHLEVVRSYGKRPVPSAND